MAKLKQGSDNSLAILLFPVCFFMDGLFWLRKMVVDFFRYAR